MKSNRTWLMMLMISVALAACADDTQDFPWLYELDAGQGVRDSGDRLMALDNGLHRLEAVSGNESTLLIGVHGFASKGLEWVYPLQTLDDDRTATYFYRWDYRGCATPAADQLMSAISSELDANPQLTTVQLVGHSFGGVLVSTLISRWNLSTPVEIHTIAAPLAGMPGLDRCPYRTPSSIADKVTVYQWRTRHQLDSAFKDLETDPQIIDLTGSQVTRLPDTYRERRLGHNWSISWVADEVRSTSDAR